MEHHWIVVNYYIKDIIETYKVMIMHLFPYDDAPLPHPFFLTLKVKGFNVIEHVWFMKTFVGKNTLEKLSKKQTNDIPILKSKRIISKTR